MGRVNAGRATPELHLLDTRVYDIRHLMFLSDFLNLSLNSFVANSILLLSSPPFPLFTFATKRSNFVNTMIIGTSHGEPVSGWKSQVIAFVSI